MHRFFGQRRNKDTIVISEPRQLHHIKNVLRLKKQEAVVICDNQNHTYNCQVEEISQQGVKFKIKDAHKIASLPRPTLTVACAIPKKSKMDDIVDKLTQLGVDRIIPMLSQRVIVRWDEKSRVSHYQRWQKIALQSARQSQRNTLPVLESIKEMPEILSRGKNFDLCLIFTLFGRTRPLKELLTQNKGARNIVVLIGPEGDFTEEEVEEAKGRGFIPASLGVLVLRVETACLAVASFIRLNAEDY